MQILIIPVLQKSAHAWCTLHVSQKRGMELIQSVSAFVYERVPLFVGLHLSIMVSICHSPHQT